MFVDLPRPVDSIERTGSWHLKLSVPIVHVVVNISHCVHYSDHHHASPTSDTASRAAETLQKQCCLKKNRHRRSQTRLRSPHGAKGRPSTPTRLIESMAAHHSHLRRDHGSFLPRHLQLPKAIEFGGKQHAVLAADQSTGTTDSRR